MFTNRQLKHTAEATRAGFVKWATTPEGRRLIARFRKPEYEIMVLEDRGEGSLARAPQPGMTNFLVASDPTKTKYYTLLLNPSIAELYHHADALDLGEPHTPVDVMAAAWAGEMLHIEFYADAITLPHHRRPEFQERWRKVAFELGFPRMRHDTEEP